MPTPPPKRNRVTPMKGVLRVAKVALAVVAAGAIIGAVFGFASALQLIIWSGGHSQFIGRIVPGIFGMLVETAIGGAIIAAITSPLPIAMLLRKPLMPCAIRIVAITAGCTFLGSLFHPGLGLAYGGVSYLATCMIVPLFFHRSWPEPMYPPPLCSGCGYDLSGIVADLCPECARQRPEPRQCRVCAGPLPTPDQSAPEWNRHNMACRSCNYPYPYLLTCQRCGHALTPTDATCPGCHRPTGLT